MVAAETILEAAEKEQADIIGLSGLITPSLDEMVAVAKEMERRKLSLPVLIGGATTSAKHTALKIAPGYSNSTTHVLDASRAVGVVEKLMNPEKRTSFEAENRQLQKKLVASHGKKNVANLVPYTDALLRRFACDWNSVDIPTPEFIGSRVIEDYSLESLRELIDWSPFFLTWELKGKYPKNL